MNAGRSRISISFSLVITSSTVSRTQQVSRLETLRGTPRRSEVESSVGKETATVHVIERRAPSELSPAAHEMMTRLQAALDAIEDAEGSKLKFNQEDVQKHSGEQLDACAQYVGRRSETFGKKEKEKKKQEKKRWNAWKHIRRTDQIGDSSSRSVRTDGTIVTASSSNYSLDHRIFTRWRKWGPLFVTEFRPCSQYAEELWDLRRGMEKLRQFRDEYPDSFVTDSHIVAISVMSQSAKLNVMIGDTDIKRWRLAIDDVDAVVSDSSLRWEIETSSMISKMCEWTRHPILVQLCRHAPCGWAIQRKTSISSFWSLSETGLSDDALNRNQRVRRLTWTSWQISVLSSQIDLSTRAVDDVDPDNVSGSGSVFLTCASSLSAETSAVIRVALPTLDLVDLEVTFATENVHHEVSSCRIEGSILFDNADDLVWDWSSVFAVPLVRLGRGSCSYFSRDFSCIDLLAVISFRSVVFTHDVHSS